ncbi:MAG: phosphoribosyltransferase family protein [Gammaproteobacteria bacterium]
MVPDVSGARLLKTRTEVDAAFRQIAAVIQPVVQREPCVLLGVLLGGLIPLARLASGLDGDFVLDTCRVGRYGDATRGGDPRWLAEPRADLRDRHLVLVDDIYDEGVTLQFVAQHCRDAGARRTTTVVLVRKQHGRAVTGFQPDVVGLDVGDEFVFGCGMDYRGHWRHLDDIWAVRA